MSLPNLRGTPDNMITDHTLNIENFIHLLQLLKEQYGGQVFVETHQEGDLGILLERDEKGVVVAIIIE